MSTQRKLTAKYTWYKRWSLLAIAAVCLCLSSLGFVFAIVTASVEYAAYQGVSAQFGAHAYALQTTDHQAAAAMAKVAKIQPVTEFTTSASAAGQLVDITVRATNSDASGFGSLEDGAWPQGVNSIALSSAAAEALRVSPGQDVQLNSERMKVTGVYVIASDSSALQAVSITANISPSETSVWLTNAEPDQLSGIRQYLDARVIQVRSLAVFGKERSSQVSDSTLGPFARAAPWCAVLTALSAASMLVVFRRGAGPDRDALSAVGIGPLRARAIIGVPPIIASLGGFLLSAGFSAAAVQFAHLYIGRIFQQSWTHARIPSIYYGLTIAGLLLAILAGLTIPYSNVRLPTLVLQRDVVRIVFVSFVVSATGLASVGIADLHIPYQATFLLGLTCATCLPTGMFAIIVHTRAAAISKLARGLFAIPLILLTLCSILIFTTSSYSAIEAQTVNFSKATSRLPQPAKTLSVFGFPDSKFRSFESRIASIGPVKATRYQLPTEKAIQTRVTSTAVVSCMRAAQTRDPYNLPTECYPLNTAAPINVVAIDPNMGDSASADPGLLDGTGSVGVLKFSVGSGTARSTISGVSARSDEALGGNLPGLTVGPRSSIAKRLDIQPSGNDVVVVYGFDDLSLSQRARLRSVLFEYAPTAQVSELGDSSRVTRETVAYAVPVVGGLVMIVLGGLGLRLVVASESSRWSRVRRLAHGTWWRRMAGAWSVLSALTGVLSCLLGASTAFVMGHGAPVPLGLGWPVPGVALAVASLSLSAELAIRAR